jgi:hypothetical protein
MLVTSRKMNDIRHGMADYYTIIAKAVGGLDPNTGAARRRLYDRARVALVAEMRSARNALHESDILAAQRSLEEAIGKIEADAEPDGGTDQPIDMPLTYLPRGGGAKAPYPPANQNGERRGPLKRLWTQRLWTQRLWTQMFRRAGDRAHGHGALAGGEALLGRFPDQRHSGPGRDTWLKDLLARASREEDEDDDRDFAPPREVRRSQ